MSAPSIVLDIITSVDQQDVLKTIVECVKKVQPNSHAVVMTRDSNQDKPTILSYSNDEKVRSAFNAYTNSTYAIDPFLKHLPNSSKSTIHHARDLLKPSQSELMNWMSKGYPIQLDSNEILGYRTKNWLRGMDEVNLGVRLFGGKILEIRLFRQLNLGGFNRDSISNLSYVFPVVSSALQMRSICQTHLDSSSNQTANRVSPTQRQLEVFRWWAAGKTLEDIGIILGIKRRTVRYHMEKARELYGYSTVQQTAIRIAQDYKFDPLTGSLATPEPNDFLRSELKM